MFQKTKHKWLWWIPILALISGLIIWWFDGYYQLRSQKILVVFCDVGQGDATLIRFPNWSTVLIDAGPTPKITACLEKYIPPWQRKISAFILTHPHLDHYGGFEAIKNAYQIEKYWDNSYSGQNYLSWLIQNQIKRWTLNSVDLLPQNSQATWNLWYPSEKLPVKFTKDLNESSIVLNLQWGKISWLFTGDLPEKMEKKLLEQNNLVQPITILKVGHHGSKYSSSHDWLKALKPKLAVISAGLGNKYFHPHPSTLQRLNAGDIPYRRTDLDGDICTWSDGEKLWLGCPKIFSWQPQLFPL